MAGILRPRGRTWLKSHAFSFDNNLKLMLICRPGTESNKQLGLVMERFKDKLNAPDNTVPDPPGTLTVYIPEDPEGMGIYIDRDGFDSRIEWCEPDNFYLFGGWYYDKKKGHESYFGRISIYNISICDLGAMSGLGNITKIPTSGFTVPKKEDSSVTCEKGHGYVIKFEKEDGSNPEYLRLYVVEPVVSAAGDITGAKVKYQYPFVPSNEAKRLWVR
jgi:hypothetical protein